MPGEQLPQGALSSPAATAAISSSSSIASLSRPGTRRFTPAAKASPRRKALSPGLAGGGGAGQGGEPPAPGTQGQPPYGGTGGTARTPERRKGAGAARQRHSASPATAPASQGPRTDSRGAGLSKLETSCAPLWPEGSLDKQESIQRSAGIILTAPARRST
jgi:hypothetical protein